MLRRAMSLAGHSTHPLARAVMKAGESRDLTGFPASDLVELPGDGLVGKVAGIPARLGSAAHCGLSDAQSGADLACWYVEDGSDPVVFRFQDAMRGDAPEVIDRLRQAGLSLSLLSGDRSETVARVGNALGIDHAQSGLRPEDKIARVDAWQKHGEAVMMVGDGINDAPALSAATVSMAPSSGSDIGRTASDLVFMGDKLSAVVDAWAIARKTRRIILQNFALAAGYNAVAIPVAALGHAGPLVAAIAMSSSSLLVTLNALRLNGRIV